jgi:hypothetical protein
MEDEVLAADAMCGCTIVVQSAVYHDALILPRLTSDRKKFISTLQSILESIFASNFG